MGNSRLRLAYEGGVDKFTYLPDILITDILSRIPTKDAVATSTLSSQWKDQWKDIDNIDLEDVSISLVTESRNYEVFPRFVEGVLEKSRAIKIHKFRLCYHGLKDLSLFQECISFAVRKHVKELDISVRFGKELRVPSEFFTCASLIDLKFEADYLFHVPFLDEAFPNLKSLHIRFTDSDWRSCQNLLRNCPNLEELVIDAGPGYWEHLRKKTRYLTEMHLNNPPDRLLIAPETRFQNLTRLEIKIDYYFVRVALPLILRATPELQILILEMEYIEGPGRSGRSCNWIQGLVDEIHLPLHDHLRQITIKSYHHRFVERAVVKYLLNLTGYLQKMTIQVADPAIKEKVANWFKRLGRSYKKCQLKVAVS